jgi:hypothetical protein
VPWLACLIGRKLTWESLGLSTRDASPQRPISGVASPVWFNFDCGSQGVSKPRGDEAQGKKLCGGKLRDRQYQEDKARKSKGEQGPGQPSYGNASLVGNPQRKTNMWGQVPGRKKHAEKPLGLNPWKG